MGLALSAVTSCCTPLACCFSQAACRLCCSQAPEAKTSTTTRIGYAMTLATTTLISYIVKTDFFANIMKNIKPLCSYTNTSLCEKVVGYEAVYRIGLTMFCFFTLMSLIMINVKSSRDIRSFLQNGLWIIKFFFILAFIIPFSMIKSTVSFNEGLFTFALITTFVYLLVQLVILIDFVHVWNHKWLENSENEHNCYFGALFTLSFIMSAASLIIIILMYVYFSKSNTQSCSTHMSIVTFQMILCIVMFVSSVNRKVQEFQPNSGIFQASAISLYTTFSIFMALTFWTHPCNQLSMEFSKNSALSSFEEISSLAFTLVLIVVNAISNSDSEKAKLLGINGNENSLIVSGGYGNHSLPSSDGGLPGQRVYDDEEDSVTYSYSLFHFILALASLYVMLIVTKWSLPQSNVIPNVTKVIQVTTPANHTVNSSGGVAAIVKVINSFVCIFIYLWTLFAPMVLPDRDFGY